jgi:hypothetical protein
LSVNFSGWNPQQTVAYTRKFVAKVKEHPSFSGPWPMWVNSIEQLGHKADVLELADHDSGSRDKFKIAQRNALNEDLKNSLKTALQYVEMVAQGDISMLEPLDLLSRQAVSKKKIPLPALMPELKVTQSKVSGVLQGYLMKCPGTVSVEIHICEGDPGLEENWARYGGINTKSRFQITGRQPGKQYWVRGCCHGPTGTSAWSPIVSIISL